jgi:hypothetical protein
MEVLLSVEEKGGVKLSVNFRKLPRIVMLAYSGVKF